MTNIIPLNTTCIGVYIMRCMNFANNAVAENWETKRRRGSCLVSAEITNVLSDFCFCRRMRREKEKTYYCKIVLLIISITK